MPTTRENRASSVSRGLRRKTNLWKERVHWNLRDLKIVLASPQSSKSGSALGQKKHSPPDGRRVRKIYPSTRDHRRQRDAVSRRKNQRPFHLCFSGLLDFGCDRFVPVRSLDCLSTREGIAAAKPAIDQIVKALRAYHHQAGRFPQSFVDLEGRVWRHNHPPSFSEDGRSLSVANYYYLYYAVDSGACTFSGHYPSTSEERRNRLSFSRYLPRQFAAGREHLSQSMGSSAFPQFLIQPNSHYLASPSNNQYSSPQTADGKLRLGIDLENRNDEWLGSAYWVAIIPQDRDVRLDSCQNRGMIRSLVSVLFLVPDFPREGEH